MYQVQFITSGIVAFSSQDRGLCSYFIECNNYGPEKPVTDPETGEIVSYEAGDCIDLFKLVKVKGNKQ